MALSIFMDSTIEVLNSVDVGGILTVACEMSDGNLAVGNQDGIVSIISLDGEIKQSFELDGKIIGLFEIDGNLIVGSSISGICGYSEEIIWTHELNSGCEIICLCGTDFLVADSSGLLFRFDSNGGLLWEKELGQMTHICSNQEGDFSAIALENGDFIIINSSGDEIRSSEAAYDDIETISSMIFRSDDVLVVSRNSLGMAIDDRPENRIECWSIRKGQIHSCEVDSLVNCITSTSKGVLLGCFNGELLELEINSKAYNQLSNFDYSIKQIFPWKEDILVASWFDIARVNPNGEIIWSLEHIGIVEKISLIGKSRVAILGDDKKQRSSTPIFIINPDSEIISNEYNFEEENFDFDSEYSGALSIEEEQASSMKPLLPADSSEIFEALDEELEVNFSPPAVEVDILEDLSQSARALNLPPIVDVGEDMTVKSDSDGTAMVLLDGSKSYDPDGTINTWSWENDSDKVISNNPQVKVKLSRGVHVFYLTIVDDRGASSKATLTVQVL